ncbi:DUF6427 family protein [Croceivirga sp. JEA036]|uniref:DUF6427 family protein n=1 Tax=Croceivirga sp. JEA036 TaxID=2721162 RepID=UPI00143970C7|nr:DUF6427 family protein [Croceivirga sp. JEA036]NJB37088.1 hypothetical protein [Croceivirga sp. JEA036]
MISTFFDRTKPVHYGILLGSGALTFWLVWYVSMGKNAIVDLWVIALLGNIALLASIYLIAQLVRLFKLTRTNSLAMFFYLVLVVFFYKVLVVPKILIASFFLLLSVSRTLALKSEKRGKEKVFEASLWLFAACLFDSWCIVFSIPIYIAIGMFLSKELRIWLMPIAALFTVAMLTFAVVLNIFSFAELWSYLKISPQFSLVFNPNYAILSYVVLALGFAFFIFGKIGYRRQGKVLILRIVMAYLILAFMLLFLVSEQVYARLIYSFFPVAVVLANYTDTIKRPRFKELFLITMIIVPVVLLCISLLQ